MTELMTVGTGEASPTWNSGTFGSATSALGALLLSVGYAASNPQPRSTAASVDYVQTEGTFIVRPAEDSHAGAFLAAVRHVHDDLMKGSIELPKEDMQLLYDGLWDMYEP